ncbi:modification methylase [Bacillus atrophaeus]|uniref:DNA methyltransferase n=1 Tax=Bacillus atrophaeus TaxID=1452 RepID=UPI000B92B9AB|nr:DNA methyltransferase [Bacillus atrophaeus]ASS73238.1 hypothetical protein BaGK_20950 [Bacillus atrophaeus]PSA90159.1 modification methylase [Bacillus atrophaeus]
MSDLINRINSYEKDFWDFKQYYGNGIEKICRYPAVMVSPMQYQLLSDIVDTQSEIKTVLDPFHGSATVLYEAKKLGLKTYGIDINPLANLIAHVKVDGVNKKYALKVIGSIELSLLGDSFNYDIHDFINIDKWFRKDIKESLSKLRHLILRVDDLHIRRYLWVCFADIVRRFSNTRSSTFKLHVKEPETINKIKNEVEKQFIKKIKSNLAYLPDFKNKNRTSLYLGDSKEVLKEKFKDSSINLICTSPPYGDNQTTVTYGQFSMLQLYWIDTMDCDDFPLDLISNYSSLDRESLGGRRKEASNFNCKALSDSLKQISVDKHKKIISFINDYYLVFKEMHRILSKNGLLVITVGNRTVDRVKIPFDTINIDMAKSFGMNLETTIERNIHNKSIPKNVSRVKKLGSVKSMTKEKTLIFRKG